MPLPPPAPSAEPPDRERKRATILLIEDHADSAVVFERLLVRRGFGVVHASTLKQGLECLEQGGIDLLIADLSLPDGSGLDVMAPGTGAQRLPAIALSGFGAPEDERRSREAGFALHLVKPVDFSVLHAAIEKLLSQTNREGGDPAISQASRGV